MYKFSQHEETIPHGQFTQLNRTKWDRQGEDTVGLRKC